MSTLVMHHRVLFTGHEHRTPPEFLLVEERPYELIVAESEPRDEVARRLLDDLGIPGAFSTRGDPASGTFVVTRERALGSRRITYEADAGTLRIERQRFGLAFFLEMLHRRRGFEEPFLANRLWALSVDTVITAIVLWAITGIWMWIEMPPTRRWGSLCLAAGSALFCFFLLVL